MKRPKGLSRLDYVKVRPVRRSKRRLKNCKIIRLLSIIHWDLVVAEGPGAVKQALHQARFHGQGWYNEAPKGDGNLVDYCEYVVSCAKRLKVINDVEWKLWFSNPKDDPRLLEFRRGFLEAKKAAEEVDLPKIEPKTELTTTKKARLLRELKKLAGDIDKEKRKRKRKK